MAKFADTNISKSRTTVINGRHEGATDGRIAMIVEVDEKVMRTVHRDASHHEGTYVAALKAMRAADRDGVTDLVIESPNSIVRDHMTKGWKRKTERLHPFQEDIEAMIADFDSVVFR